VCAFNETLNVHIKVHKLAFNFHQTAKVGLIICATVEALLEFFHSGKNVTVVY
jgi:hypothetical protein